MLHRENGKKLLYTHALGKGLERREELELIVHALISKCLALHHIIGTVQPASTAKVPCRETLHRITWRDKQPDMVIQKTNGAP
jgi:hypothetical protein